MNTFATTLAISAVLASSISEAIQPIAETVGIEKGYGISVLTVQS